MCFIVFFKPCSSSLPLSKLFQMQQCKHEAFRVCYMKHSQITRDVYIYCFSPVKPHWPDQHTLNPAHSILKTCQLYFQTMPITSALHMWLDLGWISFQAFFFFLLNHLKYCSAWDWIRNLCCLHASMRQTGAYGTGCSLFYRCVKWAYLPVTVCIFQT